MRVRSENEMPLPQKLMKKVMKPLEKDMKQVIVLPDAVAELVNTANVPP